MAWSERHPRWTFHFTPTAASWLNAVEGLFAKLTRRRLRRGTSGSLVELQAAITRFLAETNADPRPFVWTARPEHILEKVRRGNQALDAIHRSLTLWMGCRRARWRGGWRTAPCRLWPSVRT
jgi:hypothetical protein